MSAAADLLEAAAFALATARLSDSPAAAFLAEELLDAGLCVLALAEHAEATRSPCEAQERFARAAALESLRSGAERASARVEPERHTPN